MYVYLGVCIYLDVCVCVCACQTGSLTLSQAAVRDSLMFRPVLLTREVRNGVPRGTRTAVHTRRAACRVRIRCYKLRN